MEPSGSGTLPTLCLVTHQEGRKGGLGDLYCSNSIRLKASARSAINAFTTAALERDDAIEESCTVVYKSSRIAKRSASILERIWRDRWGTERETEGRKPVVTSGVRPSVECTLAEILATEAGFGARAADLATAEVGAVVLVERHLKLMASLYGQLFDPSSVTEIVVETSSVDIWKAEKALGEHHAIVEFLRLFASCCSIEPPQFGPDASSKHIVQIVNLSELKVDGVLLQMNAPRKAAMFTLAILGTDEINVEAFARLYDNYLTGSNELANYCKIFAQAMQGLRKSLPLIYVCKGRPHHRAVIGVTVTSSIETEKLRKWLSLRRQKV